jgi:nicotinamide-nucleotide amidase
MRAEIIAVGSELLSFGRVESNSLFLASRLIPLGFDLPRKSVVADDPEVLTQTLDVALQASKLVLITGGLGPTEDDVTRDAVARHLGRKLREDPELLERLNSRYRRFAQMMTDNNRRQACVPEGAVVFPNPIGTAPGLGLEHEGRRIVLLPGPPRELEPMVDRHVVPWLKHSWSLSPRPLRIVKVAGEAESAVDHRIAPLTRRERRVQTTILSSPGIVSLYFLWSGGRDPEAERILDDLVESVCRELGDAVYSRQEESPAAALGKRLSRLGWSLAVAESCTGGWIGKLVTDVAGSSNYFRGGIVSYSNEVKIRVLGVERVVLESEGAVSAAVAEAMAENTRRLLEADIGLSATGVAGPSGGSEAKPVGTVFLGLAREGRVASQKLWFPGDREAVRLRTAHVGLDWVRRECDAAIRRH